MAEFLNSVIVNRDPCHSVDLLSNDLSKTAVIKGILAECKKIGDLVNLDRVDYIRIEAINQGVIHYKPKQLMPVETRMNKIHDYVRTSRKQKVFLNVIPDLHEWKDFYITAERIMIG